MDRSTVNDMTLDGIIAPPMANGELVFELPWQGRIFGMARALCNKGLYEWDEFREHLIAEIGAWDAASAPEQEYHYYELFSLALQKLLAEKGICDSAELNARASEFQQRPAGHDH
jgi:nitrile hydratase accessory protein